MKIVMLILTLTIWTTSYSANIVKINKGDPAPFSGVLVTNAKLDEFAGTKKKSELQDGKIRSLEALSLNLKDQIAYQKDRARTYQREVLKADTKRFFSNSGYFILGVLLTGVAAKAAIESTR